MRFYSLGSKPSAMMRGISRGGRLGSSGRRAARGGSVGASMRQMSGTISGGGAAFGKQLGRRASGNFRKAFSGAAMKQAKGGLGLSVDIQITHEMLSDTDKFLDRFMGYLGHELFNAQAEIEHIVVALGKVPIKTGKLANSARLRRPVRKGSSVTATLSYSARNRGYGYAPIQYFNTSYQHHDHGNGGPGQALWWRDTATDYLNHEGGRMVNRAAKRAVQRGYHRPKKIGKARRMASARAVSRHFAGAYGRYGV